MNNFDKVVEDLEVNGLAVIEDFLDPEEVEEMKSECKAIIDKMDIQSEHTIFTTGESQKANQYFMTSGDKIRYFYEKNAFDSSGQLVSDKYSCLNKMGHSLHWLNPVFKRNTFSHKVKRLVKHLGFVDPVVVQSMYIFKNPGIGGEVVPHQDSTFLHSNPDTKVVGIWFALEDATTENGCLSFIRGSHKDGLNTQWVRTGDENNSMKLTKENIKYNQNDFKSAPVSKGSAVIIDGLVVHQSDVNRSRSGRPIYTFHIFDQHNRQWDPLNWLQPSQDLPFPSLYNN